MDDGDDHDHDHHLGEYHDHDHHDNDAMKMVMLIIYKTDSGFGCLSSIGTR